jgi:hypothetical protein
MIKTILISGKAGHGKDTIAEIIEKELVEKYKQRVLNIRFADMLKFNLTKYHGWNGIKDKKGRDLLQKHGVITYENNEGVWGKIVVEIIKAYESLYDYVIIPDLRFKAELQAIRIFYKIKEHMLFIENKEELSFNEVNEITLSNLVWCKIHGYILNKDRIPKPYINKNLTKKQREHLSEIDLDDELFRTSFHWHNIFDYESNTKFELDCFFKQCLHL